MSIEILIDSEDGPKRLIVKFATCEMDLLMDLVETGVPGAAEAFEARKDELDG